MEYLDGRDLQDVLRSEARLGPFRAAWIMGQVAAALAAAHAAGVIHRDLKPGNIMLIDRPVDGRLQRDFVKVCDFGLAKILEPGADDSQGPLTRQGAVFGTPAYMSPEQAQGLPLDARTDVYACGAVLFKLLAGRAPFRGHSATAVLTQHIAADVPSLQTLGVEVDPRLEALIQRCMMKEPAERPASAREVRDALRDILRDAKVDLPSFESVQAGPVVDVHMLDLPVTVPVVPAVSNNDDDFADTALVATLNADDQPSAEAAMASFSALERTVEPTVGSLHIPPAAPWWTWAPGALALVLAGALLLYLMIGTS